MRRVSERRKRKRDYATTVQWMWQWQWQWHGSGRGRGTGRGEMELLRRRRWRRYMVTNTHTHTQRDTHTYAGSHTCDLAGRMYSLNELLSAYTEPRLQFSAFGFHFLLVLLLSFCLFWAWLSSDVSWCCCWQCCFCVDCCSCQPAASCLLFAVVVVVVAFVLLFKLFRLFSCVMARLCAIFISSKWISHPLPAQWSSCSQLLFVLLF